MSNCKRATVLSIKWKRTKEKVRERERGEEKIVNVLSCVCLRVCMWRGMCKERKRERERVLDRSLATSGRSPHQRSRAAEQFPYVYKLVPRLTHPGSRCRTSEPQTSGSGYYSQIPTHHSSPKVRGGDRNSTTRYDGLRVSIPAHTP